MEPTPDRNNMRVGGQVRETPEAGLNEISWYVGGSVIGIREKNHLSGPDKSRRLIGEGRF